MKTEDTKEEVNRVESVKSVTESELKVEEQQTAEQAIQSCLTGDDLASFLIRSACNDATITYYLYWYLKVEVSVMAKWCISLLIRLLRWSIRKVIPVDEKTVHAWFNDLSDARQALVTRKLLGSAVFLPLELVQSWGASWTTGDANAE